MEPYCKQNLPKYPRGQKQDDDASFTSKKRQEQNQKGGK